MGYSMHTQKKLNTILQSGKGAAGMTLTPSRGGTTTIPMNQGSNKMSSVVALVLGSGSNIFLMIVLHSLGTKFEIGAGEAEPAYIWT